MGERGVHRVEVRGRRIGRYLSVAAVVPVAALGLWVVAGNAAEGEAEDMATAAGEKATSAAVGPERVGQCKPNRVKYGTDTRDINTASPDFMELPGTGFRFTQGRRGCVIATLSAEVATGNDRDMAVRARIGGAGAGDPGPVIVGRSPTTGVIFNASMQWVFPNVARGKRRIRIDFRREGGPPGSTVSFRNRTLTVEHIAG